VTKTSAKPRAKFQPGDLVELKSGGPQMTVKAVRISSVADYLEDEEQQPHYKCQWFAGKKLELGDFGEASLKAAGKPPGPSGTGDE